MTVPRRLAWDQPAPADLYDHLAPQEPNMPNPTRVLSHRDDVRAAFGDDATVVAIDGPEGTDFVVCIGETAVRVDDLARLMDEVAGHYAPSADAAAIMAALDDADGPCCFGAARGSDHDPDCFAR